MEALFAFVAGLLIGSFLNVCIYRLPRDLSVVKPRSFCPECEKTVAWYDNIPLLSYVLLRGRCRNCKANIPLRYPIVELATGLLFAFGVYRLGVGVPALKFCVFSAIIVTLIGSDLEERILPDEFTLGGVLVGLVFSWFVYLSPALAIILLPYKSSDALRSLVEAVAGAVIAAGAIYLVAFVYQAIRKREGMGLGDVKMIAMIGAFLGLQGALLTLVVGSLLGGIVGVIFIFATGKQAATYQLPFGSFLGASAMLITVFGDQILRWYFGLGA